MPRIATGCTAASRERPYDDGFTDGGFLRYRYRGDDPRHRDNAGLRLAMQRRTPLIYLHGIVPGLYEPAWPVFIVEDHPEELTFIVAIDDQPIHNAKDLYSTMEKHKIGDVVKVTVERDGQRRDVSLTLGSIG